MNDREVLDRLIGEAGITVDHSPSGLPLLMLQTAGCHLYITPELFDAMDAAVSRRAEEVWGGGAEQR